MLSSQQGFTFIEVLVSMVIFAVAFLGLNALQIQAFRENNTALLRTQATYLAYDLADRVRANAAMATVDADNNLATPDTLPAINYGNIPIPASPPGQNCASTACTAQQLATNDLFEVNRMASMLLPNGTLGVTPSGSTYTITIAWHDPFLNIIAGGTASVSLDVQP